MIFWAKDLENHDTIYYGEDKREMRKAIRSYAEQVEGMEFLDYSIAKIESVGLNAKEIKNVFNYTVRDWDKPKGQKTLFYKGTSLKEAKEIAKQHNLDHINRWTIIEWACNHTMPF